MLEKAAWFDKACDVIVQISGVDVGWVRGSMLARCCNNEELVELLL